MYQQRDEVDFVVRCDVVYYISCSYPAPMDGEDVQDRGFAVDNQVSFAKSISGKHLFKAGVFPRESISSTIAWVNV